MILESFHSVGRLPEFSDLLNKYVSDGAILEAHSFNKRVGNVVRTKGFNGIQTVECIANFALFKDDLCDSLETGGTGW